MCRTFTWKSQSKEWSFKSYFVCLTLFCGNIVDCFFIRHYFSFFFCASLHHQNVQQIIEHKIDLKVESKVGSLANIKHKPGGGDKKVFNDVEYLRQTSSTLQSGNVSRTSSRRESATQVTPLSSLNKIDKNLLLLCLPASHPIWLRSNSVITITVIQIHWYNEQHF